MFWLAIRNLFQERTKLLITIGGVAFSVLLIVMLNGLYQGWNTMMGSYAASIEADLWVEQKGVGDMYHTLSFLPDDLEARLEQTPGVKNAFPYLGRSVLFTLNDKEVTLFIVGLNPTTGVGKPTMEKGTWQTLSAGEIIIDAAFARNNDVMVGDTLSIAERDFRVAGISNGGNLVTSQYAFIHFDDAKTLFQLGNKVNFYIVQLAAGASAATTEQAILDRFSDTNVLTKNEFVQKAKSVIQDTFLPIIFILDLIALLVGIAVIGLTTYSATIEKAREYGVMKAIGFNNRQLLTLVFYQALIAGLIGYAVGVALAFPIGIAGEQYASAFLTNIRPFDLAWVFGLTALMVLVAAYIPVRRISRIDPAEVFKN
ncbi:MAG: FtsX-like permease family protein [Patescibacteria group bacterium]